MNITKCPKCRYSLIEEEVGIHECKEPLDCKIRDNIAYFFDGKKWYPTYRFTNRSFTQEDANRRFDRILHRHL
jgi:hypothetical protein